MPWICARVTHDTLSRLEFIRRSQIAGLTLAQIQIIPTESRRQPA